MQRFLNPLAKNIPAPRRVYLTMRLFGQLVVLGALGWLLVAGLSALWQPETFTADALWALSSALVVLIAVIILFTLRHLVLLVLDTQRRLPRLRMTGRFLAIFSITAALPALFVAAFGLFLVNFTLANWFQSRVETAMGTAEHIGDVYVGTEANRLRSDLQVLAENRRLLNNILALDWRGLKPILSQAQGQYGLTDMAIYSQAGRPLATASAMHMVGQHEVEILISGTPNPGKPRILPTQTGEMLAAMPLRTGHWLVVNRSIPQAMVTQLQQAQTIRADYDKLAAQKEDIRRFLHNLLLFILVVTLAGGVWLGLRLAKRIMRPVQNLVDATERVSAGNFNVRIPPENDDELGILTQSFNRMTGYLKDQQELLNAKNTELQRRRRTMEAVLKGVPAAVLSITKGGKIEILNEEAGLWGLKKSQFLKKALPEVYEEVQNALIALDEAGNGEQQGRVHEAVVSLQKNNEPRRVQVRCVPQHIMKTSEDGEKMRLSVKGFVLTLDDITPLVSAQKTAAWGDVARRLAHEIKNPLTPIQLSTERIRRKYGKVLEGKDKETMDDLTATIIKQTEHMRSLLNEFTEYARMPAPVFSQALLFPLINEAMALQQGANGHINFTLDYQAPKHKEMPLDVGQMQQVLNNLLQNAANAMNECPELMGQQPNATSDAILGKKDTKSGKKDAVPSCNIVVRTPQPDTLCLEIKDNGCGLPDGMAEEEFFQPYITTRKKGTGLGLAIVKRIITDHGGTIRLQRRSNVEAPQKGVSAKGTVTTITLPLPA